MSIKHAQTSILTRFLENFLESEYSVCDATARTKTAFDILLQLCFKYFAASVFKALGIHSFREAKKRDATVVSAFSHVCFLVFLINAFISMRSMF